MSDTFENILNPPARIKTCDITINNKLIKYHVIDDGVLIGGTKQRFIYKLLEQIPQEEIIYAGPDGGFAQLALAYTASILKSKLPKNITIFLQGPEKYKSVITQKAQQYGAKIMFAPKYRTLKETQSAAAEYHEKDPQHRYLLEFGVKSPKGSLNYDLFFNALKHSINIPEPKRLWLVAGSGFILDVLHEIYPNTQFMVIQVGKKIWPDQLRPSDQLFISPLKFTESTTVLPPYKSIPWYDAKLWEFFLKYGCADDYIWNVGAV